MKIYTKLGDGGSTCIIGDRVRKNDPIIQAIGNLDELNAYLAFVDGNGLIRTIQDSIFRISSKLVGAKLELNMNIVLEMEQEIDFLTKDLPELTNFIIPGGCDEAKKLFLARAICRRAERSLVELDRDLDKDLKEAITFLNRTSDYLFTLSRYQNYISSCPEVVWKSNT